MIDKLERILDKEQVSEPKEIKKQKELFSKIYITNYALAKARAYACLALDRQGSPTECYGFLLGNLNKRSRLVDDVYFAPGQEVNAAHVTIPAEKVIEAGREIRQKMPGKRVVGWWHSHANFFDPFHSSTDDDNLKTVLNQIAPTNYLNIYKEMDFLNSEIKKTKNNNSTLYICDKNNNSKRLELIFSDLEENPLTGTFIEKLKIRIPIKIGYAFSMVVNAKGDYPYTEIATKKFCPTCWNSEYDNKIIPIKIIDYGEFYINKDELKKEVKDRLVLPRRIIVVPRFLRRIWGMENDDDSYDVKTAKEVSKEVCKETGKVVVETARENEETDKEKNGRS